MKIFKINEVILEEDNKKREFGVSLEVLLIEPEMEDFFKPGIKVKIKFLNCSKKEKTC